MIIEEKEEMSSRGELPFSPARSQSLVDGLAEDIRHSHPPGVRLGYRVGSGHGLANPQQARRDT